MAHFGSTWRTVHWQFPNLYATSQNWDNITKDTFREWQRLTSYGVFVAIGAVRIRQFRVRNESCTKFSSAAQFLSTCRVSFNEAIQDTQNYTGSWATIDKTQPETPGHCTYQSAQGLMSLPMPGQFATYPGGYVVDVSGPKQSAAMLGLLNRALSWIDNQTRAVIIDFTLLNTIVDMFTVVELLFEFTLTGVIATSHNLLTSQLCPQPGNYGTFVFTCEILFLVMMLMFLYYEINYVRPHGVREYITSVLDCIEVFNVSSSRCVVAAGSIAITGMTTPLIPLSSTSKEYMMWQRSNSEMDWSSSGKGLSRHQSGLACDDFTPVPTS